MNITGGKFNRREKILLFLNLSRKFSAALFFN